jgi:hypothetical protein
MKHIAYSSKAILVAPWEFSNAYQDIRDKLKDGKCTSYRIVNGVKVRLP